MSKLPIESILPELQHELAVNQNVVLTAQPGAGKTTWVPLALLKEPWLTGSRIVLLEPRRLAARAAAHRMATTLGEKVGQTVGYRIRMDTQVSPGTRIEVVTEGILTRMLQQDPSLARYGLVIFDEFHERSLHADLGLALCLDAQKVVRDDLRLLVMSATLDCVSVSVLLDHASVVTCDGQLFPVETHYFQRSPRSSIEPQVVEMVNRAFTKESGNILVFLPGQGEIRRVERLFRQSPLASKVLIAPLYGDLPQEAQDHAIQAPPRGVRKIVLSTAIAETSITIEGIRVVIDAGLMRVPRFDPRSGLMRLDTMNVSRDSADQRRGRAGRLEPGVCYRLWSQTEERGFLQRTPPEILETDLSSFALELALWGVTDPSELAWMDPPPSGAFSQARALLQQLGALDDEGRLTAHGKQMVGLPVHPRLATMILKAQSLGLGGLACQIAALLGERDMVKPHAGMRTSDLRLRLEVLQGNHHIAQGLTVDRVVGQRVKRVSEQLRKAVDLPFEDPRTHEVEKAGILLAFAYPDRVAQRQERSRFKLANGRRAHFPQSEALAVEDYLVIPHLDGDHQGRIFLALPILLEDVEHYCGNLIGTVEFVRWDDREKMVHARKQRRLGELCLHDQALPDPNPELIMSALLHGIRQEGPACLPWTKDLRTWQARVLFMRRMEGEQGAWPDVGDATLMNTLEEWLAPCLTGVTRLAQVTRLDLKGPLHTLLTWQQLTVLDQKAPAHLIVPTGSRIALNYSSEGPPIVAVRLQEMFGLQKTPKIADGKVPVVIHLLSPARRPVQVTQDLASFWETGYPEVKKELKGRYPKHYWPEDPLQAEPTRKVKRTK